jgi:hypothetical protein
MRRTVAALGAPVLLLFTGPLAARAEPQQWPQAGPTVRAGTAVGFSEIGGRSVSTLGGQLAIGFRIGRLAVDAEYESLAMLQYLDELGENTTRGRIDRLGLTGRLFALRIGGHRPDPSSVLRLYLEGGAGLQSGRWSSGERFRRNDISAGGGWLLDHRSRRRRAGLPLQSIGWQLGWRLSAARADGESVFARSRCAKCPPSRSPPMPGPATDLALLVTCSMTGAW